MFFPFDHKFKYINRLYKIISKLTVNNVLSLTQKQLVIELSQTLVTWAKQRYIEYQRIPNNPTEFISPYYEKSYFMVYSLSRLAINI